MTRRAILLLITLISTSCTGSLFKVKPVTELPPLPANTRTADAGGVTIRVAPLLTDEESQELFEANLPLSGVLPVRVELAFQSGVPVEIKRARFRLRDANMTLEFRCNLACEHCMIEGTMDHLHAEPPEKFNELLAYNAASGRWSGLIMTGSEITLRHDLPKLATQA